MKYTTYKLSLVFLCCTYVFVGQILRPVSAKLTQGGPSIGHHITHRSQVTVVDLRDGSLGITTIVIGIFLGWE